MLFPGGAKTILPSSSVFAFCEDSLVIAPLIFSLFRVSHPLAAPGEWLSPPGNSCCIHFCFPSPLRTLCARTPIILNHFSSRIVPVFGLDHPSLVGEYNGSARSSGSPLLRAAEREWGTCWARLALRRKRTRPSWLGRAAEFKAPHAFPVGRWIDVGGGWRWWACVGCAGVVGGAADESNPVIKHWGLSKCFLNPHGV